MESALTEKLLPYDRAIVPQETGYWCGPAATQVVLNSRGIAMSEAELARQVGTTVNGTDYVGLIERVLDNITPDARYTSVYIENDPPSPAQKDVLWRNIVRSIDAGYGVVMNWVAPPSNYPRGVKGSQSPTYRGGTVFHYVACMGYDDQARALWIADSGFPPFGYWISFDQAASLIPPKGYCYADMIGVQPETPGLQAVAIFAQLMSPTALSTEQLGELLPAYSQCLTECDCRTVPRIAMHGAQTGHESVGLRYFTELWGPTADQAGYEGRIDLGNTQPGDGYRFRGRGPIQVTGRRNYTALSRWAFSEGLVPSPTFFADDPDQLSSETYGFIGVTWYWTTQRPMNSYADRGDIVGATQAVNGGTNGLADRTNRYQHALSLGDQLVQLLNEEDDFMSALTPEQQLELLDNTRQIAKYRRKSLSPLRWPYEGEVNTCAGFAWSGDGNIHVVLVEKLAVDYGDAQAIALLYAVSHTDEPGREGDSKLADKILAKVAPADITAAQIQIKAWLDAEAAAKTRA